MDGACTRAEGEALAELRNAPRTPVPLSLSRQTKDRERRGGRGRERARVERRRGEEEEEERDRVVERRGGLVYSGREARDEAAKLLPRDSRPATRNLLSS